MAHTNDLLVLTNPYGARVVVCEGHLADVQPHVHGSTAAPLALEDIRTDEEAVRNLRDVCTRCRSEWQHKMGPEEMRVALTAPDFSHTRAKRYGVLAYRYDATSPSGFMLSASLDEKRFDALYAELRNAGLIHSSASPLSPTEPR